METTRLTFVIHCKDKFISNDGNVVPDDMEGKEVEYYLTFFGIKLGLWHKRQMIKKIWKRER